MKILVCAATQLEIEPLLSFLTSASGQADKRFPFDAQYPVLFTAQIKDMTIDGFVTGPGLLPAAFHLGWYLERKGNCDILIHAGIAGSFKPAYPPGSVVKVKKQRFADYGATSPEGFLDMFDTGLWDANTFPFDGGWLVNPAFPTLEALKWLPDVTSVTVNRASGTAQEIEYIRSRWNPDIESMEGGGIFYASLLKKVPFVEIRSISNYVEIRDTSKWDIPLAVENLNATLILLLEELIRSRE